MKRRLTWLAVLAFALLPFAGRALARSLSWPSMDVTAKLLASGDLRVEEVLVYEFEGDWNGGERSFDLRQGQSITIHGISRVDAATGRRTPLHQGSLDELDAWAETSAGVLRWRARLPSDPPFHEQRITYAIDYTYRGVVVREGERLRIAHDFAFPKREGSLDRFTLSLDFDPGWQVPVLRPLKKEAEGLPPGDGVVIAMDLTFAGDQAGLYTVSPEQVAASASQTSRAVVTPASRPVRLLIAVALVTIALVLVGRFRVRENALGRFEPIDPAPLQAEWLEREIFAHPPEVVGAAWDQAVAGEEVAAVLMRLQRDGKLEATMGPQEGGSTRFLMRLLAPIESFGGYERALLESYFIAGDTVTNDTLRAHYRSSGFQPAKRIEAGVMERVNTLFGESASAHSGPRVALWMPFFLAGPVLAAAGVWSADPVPALITAVVTLFVGVILNAALGTWFRSRVDFDQGMFALCGLPAWLGLAAGLTIVLGQPLPALTLAGAGLVSVCTLGTFLAAARSGRGKRSMEGRKRLARARLHLARELAKPSPGLKDEWYPWLVAFGLEQKVTRWAQSFGGVSASTTSRRSSFGSGASSSASSSSGSPGSFTGGGGSFGGAGASAVWTAAAASISSPSSSRSGGGGSSSSSSSGGGGGGGW